MGNGRQDKLGFRGMYEAIIALADMQQELPAIHQYNALYIIRHQYTLI
jgi:hypothetical protein